MYMVEKFISHRGNLVHKDLNRENKIASIMDVIEKGFDCEIDIWSIDNNLHLGHDKPDEKIKGNKQQMMAINLLVDDQTQLFKTIDFNTILMQTSHFYIYFLTILIYHK